MNGLWHWDAHGGSRKVLTARGELEQPILFGVLDDRSRLACHLQWYMAEDSENVAHGLSQAFQKRKLPRSGCPCSVESKGSSVTRISGLLRGFSTCCLRFMGDVATAHARLASGWLARLYREGVEPSGLR